MMTAFLTQFPQDSFHIEWRPFLRDPTLVQGVLQEIQKTPGIVFHALVAADRKQKVNDFCAAQKLPVCDLTGSFVAFLANASGMQPEENLERLHVTDAAYKRRIEAMEFTLNHDDGLGLPTVHEADIVLAGVSRTSKTPTSVLLAQQGYKVANVSLALGVDPPAELLALSAKKVVGLYIEPSELVEIRTRRHVEEWKMSSGDYNEPEAVGREILWSRRLFSKQGWPQLDVTNYAVEETAARVVAALGLGSP